MEKTKPYLNKFKAAIKLVKSFSSKTGKHLTIFYFTDNNEIKNLNEWASLIDQISSLDESYGQEAFRKLNRATQKFLLKASKRVKKIKKSDE